MNAPPRQNVSVELRGQAIPYLIVVFLVVAVFIGLGLQELAGIQSTTRAPVVAEPLPPFDRAGP
ncbi:MAG: hypothetical protein HOM68_25125 [Gemmatimonadetes bacterium]|jgi:hypothetical protein|nr:hypothetical protein [Gemmatimonadota bacterium]MBT4609643.1 hypothetical protein [Gemmatimonadota bacterium]MBT5059853.1 hypothetical protein [Gemmatimonadota bacterium]MBT5141060.1 hypothetical protein [Gemmatimonadota bacterium]MBT5587875.1 hypothetical protein [Gemmatimonadota bacterium]